MPRKRHRSPGRLALRLAVLLAVLPLLYVAGAVIGGAVPVNGQSRRPVTGTLIWVVDYGIHTGLVLPAGDFRDRMPPAPATRGEAPRTHLAFGWGDRDFYLHTPSWRQANPLRAGRALIGSGRTVLHVAQVAEPRAGPGVRPLILRPDEYRRLEAFVRASFAPGPSVPGYGSHDRFYPARGRYSAINTCNSWTGGALRAAGVRIGAWTPLDWSVMQWL